MQCRIESITPGGVVHITMREPVITRSINVTKDELVLTYIQHQTSIEHFDNQRINQPEWELIEFAPTYIII